MKTQLNSEATAKADGYSPVNTKDQEVKGNSTTETERDAKQSKNTSNTKTQALLSDTQLILRRGLTLLVLLLILAVGIAFHFAFPVPEPSVQSSGNFTLNWVNVSTPTPLPALDLTSNL